MHHALVDAGSCTKCNSSVRIINDGYILQFISRDTCRWCNK